MPEDTNCQPLQPPGVSDHRKKKKTKRKKATSVRAPENKDKPSVGCLPPDIVPVPMLPPKDPRTTQGTPPKLRGTSKKNRGRSTGNDKKSKKCHKDSHALLKASQRSGGFETVALVRDPSVQARESLRWEGVLQDPLEEAKRLEQYRANRRQRYIAHREALSTETRQTMR